MRKVRFQAYFDQHMPAEIFTAGILPGQSFDPSVDSLYGDYFGFSSGGLTADEQAREVLGNLLRWREIAAMRAALFDDVAEAIGVDGQQLNGLLAAQALEFELGQSGDFLDLIIHSQAVKDLADAEIAPWLALNDDKIFIEVPGATTAPMSGLSRLAELLVHIVSMQRSGLFIRKVGIDAETLAWLAREIVVGQTSEIHWVALELLNIAEIDRDPATRAERFRHFLRFIKVGRSAYPSFEVWRDVLNSTFNFAGNPKNGPIDNDPDFPNLLAAAHGVDPEFFRPLIDPTSMPSSPAIEFAQFRRFESSVPIAEALVIADGLGTTPKTMIDWIKGSGFEVTHANVQAALDHLRSQYSASRWLGVQKPLRDQLRTQQRDALLAYVESYYDFGSPHYTLFDWLLIDAKMEACAITSRLKSAISSLQTYYQRILLGLCPFGKPACTTRRSLIKLPHRARRARTRSHGPQTITPSSSRTVAAASPTHRSMAQRSHKARQHAG